MDRDQGRIDVVEVYLAFGLEFVEMIQEAECGVSHRLGEDEGKGGEEESDEESGDGRVDWLVCRGESVCPNVKDLPGEDPP